MNIKKLLEDLTRPLHIQAYNQKEEYLNKWKEEEQLRTASEVQNALFLEDLNKQKRIVDELTEQVDLLEPNNKHSSLKSYQDWMKDNIKPTAKYYDFGYGKRQPHTIFADSLAKKEDKDEIWRFIVKDIGFSPEKYLTVDNMVFGFCRAFSYKFPTRKYYRTEQELNGVAELWEKATVTITRIREEKLFGDCDAIMVLKYCCIYMLIEEYYPKEIKRIRGFIVDLKTGGGHAMLGWLRGEDINDWVPIETTFYDDEQSTLWVRNYVIRDQILYNIRYSFDSENEYVKI